MNLHPSLCNKTSVVALLLALGGGGLAVAQAAPLLDWYAGDWAGPDNAWVSRTGSQTLFYDTYQGSAPQRGTSTLGGQSVDTVEFDGNDFFTLEFDSTHPLVGRNEFSISLVFKSHTDPAGAATSVNSFFSYKGIVGHEVVGPGVGDWGIGIWNDGTPLGAIGAATGLSADDEGTTGGNINDAEWHTLTFVVDRVSGEFFSQHVYVDGVKMGESPQLAYGGVSVIAKESFSVGQIRNGESGGFSGSIAAIRFDGAALQPAEITALHSTYLGLVTEPEAAEAGP